MDYTEEQIKTAIEEIEKMDHTLMCMLWRFGGNPIYFDSTTESGRFFKEKLFTRYGGFTPEISKKIGW
jgi:hypothetical protein